MLALRRIPRTETEDAKAYIEGVHPVHAHHTRAQTHKRTHARARAHTHTHKYCLFLPDSSHFCSDPARRAPEGYFSSPRRNMQRPLNPTPSTLNPKLADTCRDLCLEFVPCGSYRRGKETSGDIDFAVFPDGSDTKKASQSEGEEYDCMVLLKNVMDRLVAKGVVEMMVGCGPDHYWPGSTATRSYQNGGNFAPVCRPPTPSTGYRCMLRLTVKLDPAWILAFFTVARGGVC